MIRNEEEKTRFLYLYSKFGFFNRNWDVVRQHFLHIKTSPLHAVVKMFLLVLSICTIFFDSYAVIIIALVSLPTIFAVQMETYNRFLGRFFRSKPNSMGSIYLRKFLRIINICNGFISLNIIFINCIILWKTLAILRMIALSCNEAFVMIYFSDNYLCHTCFVVLSS
ncbi:hypothetical protein MXB_320 [Myxobolus squamalis]|nr:hypothetical protein MXB_320 [Myxobolus squamalis]